MPSPLELRIDRTMRTLEPFLAEAIGANDAAAELVERDLRLALPVSIATELSERALSGLGISAQRLQWPLPPEFQMGPAHQVLLVREKVIIDPTPCSFTGLVSLRPQEAQTNPTLCGLYPPGKIGVFTVGSARGAEVQFAKFLRDTESEVRKVLGRSGLRDASGQPNNGILFGQRDKGVYLLTVRGLWDMSQYEPVPEPTTTEAQEQRIAQAVKTILALYQRGSETK